MNTIALQLLLIKSFYQQKCVFKFSPSSIYIKLNCLWFIKSCNLCGMQYFLKWHVYFMHRSVFHFFCQIKRATWTVIWWDENWSLCCAFCCLCLLSFHFCMAACFSTDSQGMQLVANWWLFVCWTCFPVVNKNCLLYEGAYQFLTFIVLVRDCWKKKKLNFLNKQLLIISLY